MFAPLLLTTILAPANLVPNPGFEDVADNSLPARWQVIAPREETLPRLLRDPQGGRHGTAAASLVGIGDRTFGAWHTTVGGVAGGTWYRVGASYRTELVARPEHSVWVKLTWTDAHGEPLRTDYVHHRQALDDGWQRTEDVVVAPAKSANVELDLYLRWTHGSVWFDDVTVVAAEPPAPRKVKLATVHFVPSGSTPDQNRQLWAAQAAAAGRQGADLVCLGEGIAMVGTSASILEVAEPVPGPTTQALGAVAKQYRMYIVAGIYEQDGPTCYNTAVLIGRDGQVVGKYHKTHLPESEGLAGLTPGETYPVFATDFGTVGMQICYDNDFPEVARSLALNGADVICTPIWGDGRFEDRAWEVVPRARAMDNGVWYVACIYGQQRSLVIDRWGNVRGQTNELPGLVVVEADLNERRQTPWLSSKPGSPWESIYRQERRPGTYGDLTR